MGKKKRKADNKPSVSYLTVDGWDGSHEVVEDWHSPFRVRRPKSDLNQKKDAPKSSE